VRLLFVVFPWHIPKGAFDANLLKFQLFSRRKRSSSLFERAVVLDCRSRTSLKCVTHTELRLIEVKEISVTTSFLEKWRCKFFENIKNVASCMFYKCLYKLGLFQIVIRYEQFELLEKAL